MSKTAQSGLRTVKRDFSINSVHDQSQSSEIEWLPTPPPAPKPKLTGAQQRLKDIQDALSGKAPPMPRGGALVDSKGVNVASSMNTNKRPSTDSEEANAAKKPRQLPPSWQGKDPLSAPSLGPRASSSSGSSSAQIPVAARSTYAAPPVSAGTSSGEKKKKVAAVFLSQEQTQILKLVQDGNSVFYTGSAGTGKSVLLREIIKTLRKKYVKIPDAIAITASTGIAACNIGGVTIHSFAGIGLGIESAEDLASKIRKNKKASTRWLRTKVLIIDEVSMVDGDLFDKLARIGTILRKKLEPFGGIQIVVTGDFFQLPPVGKHGAQVKFAFEAKLWSQTVQRTFNLTKVFRQRDQEFVDMLNEMRFGRLTPKSIAKFRSLSREIEYEDGLGATELFPRREDVDRSNSFRMTRLQTQQQRYTSVDGGSIQDETQRQKMLGNFMAPRDLMLRIDAQVMLIKNVDDTLVNGSMGRVHRFVDPAVYGTEYDVDGAGVGGEANVIGTASVTANVGSAAKKGGGASGAGQVKLYPVVEFLLPSGGKRYFLVMPEVWKVELPSGEVQVSRCQLPLILAWAMSIHKSQGQTLDRVRVDLGKVFEKGQAYVALSRATSLEGLQVLNFDPNKVNAHPKVAEWSKTLETVME
ncbi:ATP-dependent DNA helicase PIF1 [Hypsizygus marmoreus]|uniref:ATP-dependent DNA helicase PIF1 n=1 Tax=Hypsizygus marmoreus TaxID=39966 RepID=A0A369J1H4_HYPMA|nr:ATP-dependent DNA helicase PIF1 [Hypsizygus marmoreus]